MSSALRSPVLWILLGCVLVILGITLLFDAQEPDTDWRRQRWSGSEAARTEPEEPADESPEPDTTDEVPEQVGVDPLAANSALEALNTLLKSRWSSNADIITSLHAVAETHGRFHRFLAPGPRVPTAPDSAYARAAQRYSADQARFNRKAEKAFLKALRLVRLDSDEERNQRADVNEAAARVFAKLAPRLDPDIRDRISKYLMRTIDRWEKAKYRMSFRVLDATFGALADLGRSRALEWMADEFIHTKNSEPHVLRLIAAHRAMVRFPRAASRPKLRHAIFNEMIRTYSCIEEQAQWDRDPNAARAFWSRVDAGVLAALQHFAGPTATHEDGTRCESVQAFETWFRDHKNRRKPPWTTR